MHSDPTANSHHSVCEERSFRSLFDDHSLHLQNFLFYKTGDLERARDLAQEAFSRLWTNCAKVIFEKAKSYLFTTANRLFLDEVDHQKVVLKFQKRSDISESQMESNPEFVYREDEFKETLESAISNLPEKQRIVFLMNRIDKMSYREISESLDINIKTVEKHVSSALRNLRENLDELNHIKI